MTTAAWGLLADLVGVVLIAASEVVWKEKEDADEEAWILSPTIQSEPLRQKYRRIGWVLLVVGFAVQLVAAVSARG